MELSEMLAQIGTWIRTEPHGRALWDVITGLRGPDSGIGQPHSELPCQLGTEHDRLYTARVARKMVTVAILRHRALGEVPGARTRVGDKVTIPSPREQDHFDKHVERAAKALGLGVEYVATNRQSKN